MAGRRDDERFEIAPRRPRGASDVSRPISRVARSVWHYARQSRFGGSKAPSTSTAPTVPHLQRCAVRITYASNRVRGQWRAHGRYVAREAATERESTDSRDSPSTDPGRERAPAAGYDRAREGLDPALELDAWQAAGDPRLFKFILSPEFGDRVNLQSLTRDVLGDLERQMGRPLTWVAVNHYNTEHPHVHVALRGVDARGKPVLLPRELVKQGVREIAQQACTRQLGYRSRAGPRTAPRPARRVLTRVTSHDQRLRAVAERLPEGQLRVTPHRAPGLSPSQKEGLRARLVHLQAMRLATPDRHGSWLVAGDFENALTALADGADRQRSLARVQAMISDPHRPARVTRWAGALDGPVQADRRPGTGARGERAGARDTCSLKGWTETCTISLTFLKRSGPMPEARSCVPVHSSNSPPERRTGRSPVVRVAIARGRQAVAARRRIVRPLGAEVSAQQAARSRPAPTRAGLGSSPRRASRCLRGVSRGRER